MKLSTRARYGTMALLDLALHEKEQPVPLKDIARRQQFSSQYLEHLVTPLIAAGILRSSRGARGGISLARSPRDIKLVEVVEILEGSIALVECVNSPELCTRSESCATRDIWGELNRAMSEVLEATTLQDLAERQRIKGQPGELMYDI